MLGQAGHRHEEVLGSIVFWVVFILGYVTGYSCTECK